MSEKPEALEVADSVVFCPQPYAYAAARLLREQHAEIERLREEVRALRLYGNKDCTAMADEAMKKAALRREETT
jgi:hypothetical protein